MADEILFEGLRFFGYHGVHPEERALGQRYYVDVCLELDLRKPAQTDRLEDTVNYSAVYAIIRSVIEGEPRQLIEAVANDTAMKLLRSFSDVVSVDVTVRKPEVTIRGAHLDAIGVRIHRTRAHLDVTQPVTVPKPPRLGPEQ